MPYNPTFHLKSESAGEVEGRQIYKPIVPQAGELDPIATHYAWFGQGGYKVCYSYEEMYSIPFERRELGMRVAIVQSGMVRKYVLVRLALGLPLYKPLSVDGRDLDTNEQVLSVSDFWNPTDESCWLEERSQPRVLLLTESNVESSLFLTLRNFLDPLNPFGNGSEIILVNTTDEDIEFFDGNVDLPERLEAKQALYLFIEKWAVNEANTAFTDGVSSIWSNFGDFNYGYLRQFNFDGGDWS